MAQDREAVGLQHYLQILRRRFPIIVGVTALIVAVSLGISLRQETIYGASSEVLVIRENLASTLNGTQVPYIDAQTAERLMETQVQLARVPALANRVITANRLPESAHRFLEQSSVSVAPKTDILIFTVRRPSPSLARRLATSYGQEFTKFSAERDRAQLETVASGVRSQLDQMTTPDARRSPLYNELQERLRQLQTMQALQSPTAEVVRRAETARKIQPRPLTAGVGGLLLGLLLGTALAFLRDSLDTRVRSSEEVAEGLGIPLLGRLPEPPERLATERRLILMEDPEAAEAEPFQFLRSTVAFANLSVQAQVVMLTSAVAGEGKSTTTANLAVAMAAAGSKVVVVDADTRRPSLDRFFRVPRSPGVTDISLTGTAPEEALVRVVAPRPQARVTTQEGSTVTTTHTALEVLPAGRSGHGVDINALAEILKKLRERADIVLVDAPPMLQVGDAAALSARVDALLIVARANVIRRPMLDELRRILESAPTPTLGFVLSGARTEEASYGGYYGRRYEAPTNSSVRAPRPDPHEPRGKPRRRGVMGSREASPPDTRGVEDDEEVTVRGRGRGRVGRPPDRLGTAAGTVAQGGYDRVGTSPRTSTRPPPGQSHVAPTSTQSEAAPTAGQHAPAPTRRKFEARADTAKRGSGGGSTEAAAVAVAVRAQPAVVPAVRLLAPSAALVELQGLLSVIQAIDRVVHGHDLNGRLGTVNLLNLVALGLESDVSQSGLQGGTYVNRHKHL